MNETKEMKYAGFWWRFLAFIIDALIIKVVKFILITPLLGVLGVGVSQVANKGDITEADVLGLLGMLSGVLLLSIIVTGVMAWLYFALMESSKFQGTLGKMALGIVVTDRDGNRISFLRATGRYFGKILSGLILLIGYMMAGFTEKKQALHDMMASTLVWKK